jgi:carbonic anhydrase/acetyltransferase-like protein (isoleucine patch superfamily)
MCGQDCPRHEEREKMILEYQGKFPKLDPSVFVANTATIVGDVEIGYGSSVWFGAVIRGDFKQIRIGEKVSIQDNCVLHIDRVRSPIVIGNEVTVGHRAVLHGCKIGNLCLIGMGSVVMDDVKIGDECIIAGGSLVPPGTEIPARTLVMGIPAKPRREITEEDLKMIKAGVEEYYHLSRNYLLHSINPYSLKEVLDGKK